MAEDFEGDWILQVGPNLSGNRRPFHVVDGVQGLSSDRTGVTIIAHAMPNRRSATAPATIHVFAGFRKISGGAAAAWSGKRLEI